MLILNHRYRGIGVIQNVWKVLGFLICRWRPLLVPPPFLIGLSDPLLAFNATTYHWSIQLQEYQTDGGRCRFDPLGKSTPARRAGAPTAHGRWVSPRTVGESDIPIATAGGPPTARGHFILPLSGGRMSGSLNLPKPFNL